MQLVFRVLSQMHLLLKIEPCHLGFQDLVLDTDLEERRLGQCALLPQSNQLLIVRLNHPAERVKLSVV